MKVLYGKFISDRQGIRPLHVQSMDLAKALMRHVVSGDPVRVRQLIAQGANINEKDSNGQTPLMLASYRSSDQEMVKLLIHNNANIDDVDWLEKTALIHACRCGKYEIIQVLLELGADRTKKDKIRMTAKDYLTFYIGGHSETAGEFAGLLEKL